jgi:hypothetical protein
MSEDELTEWIVENAGETSGSEGRIANIYFVYTGEVTVPDVTDLLLSTAKELLKEQEIYNCHEESTNGASVWDDSNWTVVSQNPNAGDVIHANDDITLVVQKNQSGVNVTEITENTDNDDNTEGTEDIDDLVPVQVKRAAVVSMTNYYAMDVFTDDGNDYDVSKFHSYSDTLENPEEYFMEVKSWGTWTLVEENLWHVEKLRLEYYGTEGEFQMSMDVQDDGTNYVISNVQDARNVDESKLVVYETTSECYTVPKDLVLEDRETSDVDALDHSDELKEYQAREALEYYGEALYPYGFECHWWTETYAHEQSYDGSWFLKVGVTITNKYGTTRDTTVEAYINNVTKSVEDFYVY